MLLKELFLNIASAIRIKDGTIELINATDFPQRILDIPSREDTLEELFAETLENYQNNDITKLPVYAFYKNTGIKKAILNNVDTVDVINTRNNYSFNGCENLEEISLEKLTVLSNYTFQNCKKLTRINLPNIKSFNSGSQSYGYTFNNVGTDSTERFKLILPNLNSIGINRGIFEGCGASVISLPRMTGATGYSDCFKECNAEIIDLGSSIAMYASTFTNAKKLKTLIIRKSSVLSVVNLSMFTGTPFATDGSGGKIYVPKSLIETYQNATNWSVLYNAGTLEIKALEDSIYADLDWANDFDVSALEVD